MMRKTVLILLLAASWLVAGETVWGETPNKLDPTYQIPVKKYPKFEADIVLNNGKKIRFCCPKSMLHFYFKPYHYPEFHVENRDQIAKMTVRDYLDGKEIDAKKAWYVFGSRLVGPHGDDLIPLATKTRAELFVKRYGGSRIMDFATVEQKGYGLVKFLDMH
ncbi:nitrous oxide reductase accessory protein NosL [Hydrogenimonas sp.]